MARGGHPHNMSSKAMKAVFDNLTSGASRRVELEYKADSAAHHEADSIEVSVWLRLSTQMHVTDWVEAQREDPEIEATMDWCLLNRRKSQPWTEQLAKLKSRLGTKKNTLREGVYCVMLTNSPCPDGYCITGTSLSIKSKKWNALLYLEHTRGLP